MKHVGSGLSGGDRVKKAARVECIAKKNKVINLPSAVSEKREKPHEFESNYVHKVYDKIAAHFSSTRYGVWPRVRAFIAEYAVPGSLLADIGCGNGKNMCVPDPDKVWCVGCDYSEPLMRAAIHGARRRRALLPTDADEVLPVGSAVEVRAPAKATGTFKTVSVTDVPPALLRGLEFLTGDALRTPLRSGIFDVVLSIAVIHHLSTEERQLLALAELIRLLRPCTGRALVYVWGREQSQMEDRDKDVLVGWDLARSTGEGGSVYRYYHVFEKGELEALCEKMNSIAYANRERGRSTTGSAQSLADITLLCKVEDAYFDKDNWVVVLSRVK